VTETGREGDREIFGEVVGEAESTDRERERGPQPFGFIPV